MTNTLILILLTAASFCHVSMSVDYNYDLSDKTYGPLGWSNTYPKSCNESRQSPIDIKASEATYDGSLEKLTFEEYDTVPAGSLVKLGNNGKSYRVFFEPHTFLVSGGGLPGKFYTHNFHLHWGADDTKGSEHTVDGKKFQAELHFVNVNQKYPNVSEALKNKDGIAALGVLLEVGAENLALTSFLKYTVNVTYKRDISNVTMTQTLGSLLPQNTSDFYRYDGSLTTPTCQEVVTWTVFKNSRTISEAQLNMLRSLRATDNTTMLTDSFRPVQPLGSRVVKKTFESKPSDNHGKTYHVTDGTTIVVSLVMAIVMFK